MADSMRDQSADWRQQLSFTDRTAVTFKMLLTIQRTEAYELANPGCTRSSARSHAKAEEKTARDHALTVDEYHELCAKSLQLLLASIKHDPPIVDSHAAEHRAPNLPEHGATIGRYTNAVHHRDGLFSEVYKALSPDRPGQLVALKITTPSMMVAPHDSAREVRVLEKLADKSRIIQLIETFQQAGGRLVLVFPFMPLELSTLLLQGVPAMPLQQSILTDLFTGLNILHDRDIIHRDIKPSNILLQSASGPAYLADFGIVWSPNDPASEPASEKHLEVGTTSYRPPELLFGGQCYDTSLDMWAAGCVAAQVVGLGRCTLFDSGELGSELALIKSIFETLGTPDLKRWPAAARLPDWGKMNFAQYPRKLWMEVLSEAGEAARDLVASLVVYEAGDRITAASALTHPFLQS